MKPSDLERRLSDTLKMRAEAAMNATNTEDQLASTLSRANRRAHSRQLMTVAAVIAVIVAGLALLLPSRGGSTPDSADAPKPADRAAIAATGVPWCIPNPNVLYGGELIVGAGPAIPVWCSWASFSNRNWLLHQAGTTVLSDNQDVYRVADGQLTQLGSAPGYAFDVTMSQDGRLAAWMDGLGTNCNIAALHVYEVATATEVAATPLPRSGCAHVRGIDDQARVYLTMMDGDNSPITLYVYDANAGTWAKVTGLPNDLNWFDPTYITANGVAVAANVYTSVYTREDSQEDSWQVPLASVEGVVEADGRFVAQRQVPVGAGVWSPDRSLVVEQRPEGVVVRPAADLNSPITLDLPAQFQATPDSLPGTTFQWTPDGSVLVWPYVAPRSATTTTYQCDPQSGACQVVSHAGNPAADPFTGRPE